jgi:hypothetical protein
LCAFLLVSAALLLLTLLLLFVVIYYYVSVVLKRVASKVDPTSPQAPLLALGVRGCTKVGHHQKNQTKKGKGKRE